MPMNGSRLQEVITQFRQILPAQSATARAIDQNELLETIVMNARNDGHSDFAVNFYCLIQWTALKAIH